MITFNTQKFILLLTKKLDFFIFVLFTVKLWFCSIILIKDLTGLILSILIFKPSLQDGQLSKI